MSKPQVRFAVISNCMRCPNCVISRTPGAGCAVDYKCEAAGNKTIAGYVEWASERPKDNQFPDFCPLSSNMTAAKKSVK